jgi:hypothetical protein
MVIIEEERVLQIDNEKDLRKLNNFFIGIENSGLGNNQNIR